MLGFFRIETTVTLSNKKEVAEKDLFLSIKIFVYLRPLCGAAGKSITLRNPI